MAMIRIKAIKDDGTSYWPSEFPIDLLHELKAEYGGIRFASEFQCSPIDMSGNFLKREWIRLYLNPPMDDAGLPNLTYYFGVDPSITGTGDYCVICVLGKGPNDRLYIVDFIRKKANLDDQINMLMAAADLYRPKIINIESSAAQELYIQHLENTTTLPVRRSQTLGKKADRFAAMSVHFQAGRCLTRGTYKVDENTGQSELTFHESMKDFILEWVAFRPNGETHDDTLDALEKALEVATFNITAASINLDAPSLKDIGDLAGRIKALRAVGGDPVTIMRQEELLSRMKERFVQSSNDNAVHSRPRRFRLLR